MNGIFRPGSWLTVPPTAAPCPAAALPPMATTSPVTSAPGESATFAPRAHTSPSTRPLTLTLPPALTTSPLCRPVTTTGTPTLAPLPRRNARPFRPMETLFSPFLKTRRRGRRFSSLPWAPPFSMTPNARPTLVFPSPTSIKPGCSWTPAPPDSPAAGWEYARKSEKSARRTMTATTSFLIRGHPSGAVAASTVTPPIIGVRRQKARGSGGRRTF